MLLAMWARPVTLVGTGVRLVPLTLAHVPGLARVGLDPELWRWIPSPVASEAEMYTYVEVALEEQRRGAAIPFATLEQATGAVIGSTRFANISAADRRVEIGWTWVARAHQRTGANTEAKLLMLTHAFETLRAVRVELKTDALNEQSRAAILRLGAKEEGILRKHRLTSSGRWRDTVYFSVLDEEWPAVKARLQERLRR
jgi:RimJ/RimL family protein N-acetyltransferase